MMKLTWTYTDANGNLRSTNGEAVKTCECTYCGAENTPDIAPSMVDGETGWTHLAAMHNDGCEWIETRGQF